MKITGIELINEPGLGVSINEAVVRRVSENAVSWKNPIWRNFDGTVAEW